MKISTPLPPKNTFPIFMEALNVLTTQHAPLDLGNIHTMCAFKFKLYDTEQ